MSLGALGLGQLLLVPNIKIIYLLFSTEDWSYNMYIILVTSSICFNSIDFTNIIFTVLMGFIIETLDLWFYFNIFDCLNFYLFKSLGNFFTNFLGIFTTI